MFRQVEENSKMSNIPENVEPVHAPQYLMVTISISTSTVIVQNLHWKSTYSELAAHGMSAPGLFHST